MPFPENQVNRYLIPGGIRGHLRKIIETKGGIQCMPIAVIRVVPWGSQVQFRRFHREILEIAVSGETAIQRNATKA
jgi:hypothetical protein